MLDLITHREKTPTAAASAAVSRVRHFDDRLRRAITAVRERARSGIAGARQRLAADGKALRRTAGGLARVERQRCEESGRQLQTRVRRQLARSRERMGQHQRRLIHAARGRALGARATWQRLLTRLRGPAIARLLARHRERTVSWRRQVRALDLRRILQRGFALVRDESGRTVRDAGTLTRGQALTVELARGAARVTVDRATVTDREASGPSTQGS